MLRYIVSSCIFALLLVGTVSAAVTPSAVPYKSPYKSPYQLLASNDGSKVFVLNHESDEIMVIKTSDGTLDETYPVGTSPNSMVLSPDQKTLYIGCGGYEGKIEKLNLETGKVEGSVPGGHTPCGMSIAPDGKTLYVCNRFTNSVAEYTLPEMKKTDRVFNAIREPLASVVSLDGKTVFAINFIPNDPADSFDVASEVTAVDTATGTVENIRLPNGSSSLHGICISPDGKYVYLTEILARYQMPTTQLERGWMNTNGISIIDVEKKEYVNTVLIDDVDLGSSNPWGVATSADGKQIYVSVAGTHELCIIDSEAMMKKLMSLPKTAEEAKQTGSVDNRGSQSSSLVSEVPNDLAFLVGMKKRIRLSGKAPRGICVAGNDVYLGMYFSDTVEKVDISAPGGPKSATIPLGPTQELTPERKGELAWHDATLCFQFWQSCASCHPDARVDALNWDLLNDGLGNPKNAKSLLQSHFTPPAMWEGVRKTSAVAIRTGFKHILFSVPNEKICDEIDTYLQSMEPLQSPHLENGQLSESAKRGKELFESKRLNCVECHPAPFYTDMKLHDVGTKASFDRKSNFDTPGLIEVWRTAPYLHDGRYVKMRDVFAEGKHGDVNGDVEGLSDKELDDLTEYIMSL